MTVRLLLNENFPAPSVALLRTRGYDVMSISDASSGLSDPQVLALAVAQKRVLVTFDLDYGELIFARGLPAPPSLLLFRVPHYRPEDPSKWLIDLLRHPDDLNGCFVVYSGETLRKRPLLRPA